MPGTVFDGEEALTLDRQEGQVVVLQDEEAAIPIWLELQNSGVRRQLVAEVASRLPELLGEGMAGVTSPGGVFTDPLNGAAEEGYLAI